MYYTKIDKIMIWLVMKTWFVVFLIFIFRYICWLFLSWDFLCFFTHCLLFSFFVLYDWCTLVAGKKILFDYKIEVSFLRITSTSLIRFLSRSSSQNLSSVSPFTSLSWLICLLTFQLPKWVSKQLQFMAAFLNVHTNH